MILALNIPQNLVNMAVQATIQIAHLSARLVRAAQILVLRGLHHHLALAVIMRKPLVQHNVVIPATLVLKMLILVLV